MERIPLQIATFGAGCFWGVEGAFRRLAGVKSTQVGYAGGSMEYPTYDDVCTDRTGHAEVVEVTFDPQVISYPRSARSFLGQPQSHHLESPGSRRRFAVPVGDLLSFARNRKPKPRLPRRRADAVSPAHRDRGLSPRQTFWRAEEYHQQYLEKRGRMPFWLAAATILRRE